jgi:hypothetical protein
MAAFGLEVTLEAQFLNMLHEVLVVALLRAAACKRIGI